MQFEKWTVTFQKEKEKEKERVNSPIY